MKMTTYIRPVINIEIKRMVLHHRRHRPIRQNCNHYRALTSLHIWVTRGLNYVLYQVIFVVVVVFLALQPIVVVFSQPGSGV